MLKIFLKRTKRLFVSLLTAAIKFSSAHCGFWFWLSFQGSGGWLRVRLQVVRNLVKGFLGQGLGQSVRINAGQNVATANVSRDQRSSRSGGSCCIIGLTTNEYWNVRFWSGFYHLARSWGYVGFRPHPINNYGTVLLTLDIRTRRYFLCSWIFKFLFPFSNHHQRFNI